MATSVAIPIAVTAAVSVSMPASGPVSMSAACSARVPAAGAALRSPVPGAPLGPGRSLRRARTPSCVVAVAGAAARSKAAAAHALTVIDAIVAGAGPAAVDVSPAIPVRKIAIAVARAAKG